MNRIVGLWHRITPWVCRHEPGTICCHRQHDYNHWYRGYIDGFAAGTVHEQGKP